MYRTRTKTRKQLISKLKRRLISYVFFGETKTVRLELNICMSMSFFCDRDVKLEKQTKTNGLVLFCVLTGIFTC